MAQAPLLPSGGVARASAGVADNNDCGTVHAARDHALLAAAVAPDASAGPGAHHHLASLAMQAAAAPRAMQAAADSPTHSSLQFHSGPEEEQAYHAAAAADHGGGMMLGAQGAASFVPRRDAYNNIPCFVQTSALFTNMCGYCGTRSTSGCWRRGWEVAPNRFINLCNKCGLRHKAGKLPAVPEPPPPQSRGRAATSGAAAPWGGASTYTHSADITSLGTASDPEHGMGHGAVDPAEAAAAPRGRTNGGGGSGSGSSASRKRRAPAKPLAPKGSRVGTSLVAEYQPPGYVSSPEQQHLLAQLLAASGAAAAAEAVSGGTLMPGMHTDFEEHAEHQRHVAALLQSLADGTAAAAAAAGGATAGSGSYAAAGASPYGAPPASAAAAAAAAAGSAGLSNASLGYRSYSAGPDTDTAQAVAAVLAAAAAGAGHGGAAVTPGLSGLSSRGFGAPLTLGSISTGPPGHAGQHDADGGSMVAPAAKKRRSTKKGPADGGDAAAGIEAALTAAAALGAAGLMARPSDDAAAAGDAADALLALHRDSPVASPKTTLTAVPPPAFTAGASALTPRAAAIRSTLTMSMGLMGTFNAAGTMASQVTSPSTDTHQGSAGTLHHLMPPAPGTAEALAPLPQSGAGSLTLHNQHLAGTPAPPLACAHWTTDHLQAWLHSCGCGEAAAALKAAGIDGAALYGLLRVATDAGAARLDDRLRSDMGVERVALRLRLVDRIMSDLTGRGSIGGHIAV